MCIELISPAYETKLSNSTAKSILVLLADQANPDGHGSAGICSLHERIEVSARVVQRHIQVFEEIELLTCEEWHGTGNRLKVTFQLSLEKLGTDLRQQFTVALSRVSELASPTTSM